MSKLYLRESRMPWSSLHLSFARPVSKTPEFCQQHCKSLNTSTSARACGTTILLRLQ
ncbi:uncharacterized protein BJ212DRAFT_1324840 [Suillus subaureus]|uniref:Uncharacterized protein n=1 Tax=Suillus subaureus TaxID=48587 RepID=A0A9P7DGQ1_9AGAM|nr:uncharacterized protein BJ212DRAFT_1418270 [Suillus subaureus]XP_041197580.1 uncharacterized protein BJ212DRAFT_1324840 [Suillus subaureus]KAG1791938.1 hypothetical protein BJ212DRAFT_1418270 [Suillus subaureus]KAG1823520.1 hypothetical protein BJ212DRAFT_1324840 [Suillus subaureus]